MRIMIDSVLSEPKVRIKPLIMSFLQGMSGLPSPWHSKEAFDTFYLSAHYIAFYISIGR